MPYQHTLAPIFLWGWFLASAHPSLRILPAFVAFHWLLYSGITAFNSYYDRDEGPVGGMERPPPVRRSLLWVSLAAQAAGAPIVALYGSELVGIYVLFVCLGVLYSHPLTRWKANPWASAAVVCGGQGWLGFLAGWAAARHGLAGAGGTVGLLGGLCAALTTLGMYPVTQLYQVEEDARRGDRTLCVALGGRGALRLSQMALLLAGFCAEVLACSRLTSLDAAVLCGAYAGLIWKVDRMRRAIPTACAAGDDRIDLFRAARALNYGSSAAFTAFILLRLARW